MAPHSSTLAWKIPWTEAPGRLQSMGSLRVDMTERLSSSKQSKRNHSIFLKEAEALRGWQKQWPGSRYNSCRGKRQLVDSRMWQRPEQLDGVKWKEMWRRQRNRRIRTPRLTRVKAKGTGTWLPLSCWYLPLLGLYQKVEYIELIKIERLIEFTLILECDTLWAINVMRWIGDKKYFLGRSWACVNIGTDSPCWNEGHFPQPCTHISTSSPKVTHGQPELCAFIVQCILPSVQVSVWAPQCGRKPKASGCGVCPIPPRRTTPWFFCTLKAWAMWRR